MEVLIIQQHKCQGKKKGDNLGHHSTIVQNWILCWAACHTPASSNTKLKQEIWMLHSGDNRGLWLVQCFGGPYCLLVQGRSVTPKMQAVNFLQCCQIFITSHLIQPSMLQANIRVAHSENKTYVLHNLSELRQHSAQSDWLIPTMSTQIFPITV